MLARALDEQRTALLEAVLGRGRRQPARRLQGRDRARAAASSSARQQARARRRRKRLEALTRESGRAAKGAPRPTDARRRGRGGRHPQGARLRGARPRRDRADRRARAATAATHTGGEQAEGGGKKGDTLVELGAAEGPAAGRIVFEAKDKKLSKNEAWAELNEAMAARAAAFGVLVVAGEESVPAGREQLHEYEGNKLIVAVDRDEPDGLALETAYRLAAARRDDGARPRPPGRRRRRPRRRRGGGLDPEAGPGDPLDA